MCHFVNLLLVCLVLLLRLHRIESTAYFKLVSKRFRSNRCPFKNRTDLYGWGNKTRVNQLRQNERNSTGLATAALCEQIKIKGVSRR